MPSRTLADWAMLLALVALWGSNFMFVKLGLDAVPPATLVASRLAIGAVILLAVVRALGHSLPPFGPVWRNYLIVALVGNCLPFGFITWGQQHIDSALAGILMAIMPLATLVLAHRFVQGERMTPTLLAGFALGFLGVVVLIGPAALSGLGGSAIEVAAQVSVLAGAMCYAANGVFTRVMLRGDVMAASAASIALAALISLPVAVVVDRPWELTPDRTGLAVIAWIGIGPTAIATIVWFKLIGSAGPTFQSLVNYLVPCVALFLGVMLLGEEPRATAYVGLGLILAGISLSRVRR